VLGLLVIFFVGRARVRRGALEFGEREAYGKTANASPPVSWPQPV
jgi:hypothetical protein